MVLSIKNVQADELASQVARRAGETKTQAVIVALEERLVRLTGRRRGPDLIESLSSISRRCSQIKDIGTQSSEMILGYDVHGTFDGD